MRFLLTLLAAAALVVPVAAHDLGNHAPAKPAAAPGALPTADPDVLRQGGDTIADGVFIPIPTVNLAGTTTGYTDDYDVPCPYWQPGAPDVVYSIVPEADMMIDIDMCGSQYDTRIWVWGESLDWPLACNDDYYYDEECGYYTSKIEELNVTAGTEYLIVVDGYSGDHGEYLIDVVPSPVCELECSAGAELEGEPPLVVGYEDAFNGGCNSPQFGAPFGQLTAPVFCGVSGWYLFDGASYRDTDWFHVQIPAGGVLEITGDAERPCYMYELGPQDCDAVGVVQETTIGDCIENSFSITGEPGSVVWFWVGPTTFSAPGGQDVYEFEYVLWTNLVPVATEAHSWTAVKELFR